MSKALLGLAVLFMLASMAFATSPFSIPTTGPSIDAGGTNAQPYYCLNYQPAATAAGYSVNQNNLLPPGTVSYQNVLTLSITLSVIALMLSVAVIALGYMLSRIVPNVGIKNWLAMEYWEVTKSAIVIASIFGLIIIVGNIAILALGTATPMTSGDITPLINGAETYLCSVNYNLMDIWSWMGLLGAGTGFWANLKIGTYDFIPLWTYAGLISGATFVPFNNWMLQTGNPMIGPYGSVIGDSVNLLLFPFTVVNSIGLYGLPSLALIGLTVFIPMGLFFRGLPFVRGIGGTMIAIGLAISLVFPATLVLFNGVFMNYVTQTLAVAPPPPPTSVGGFPCPFGSFYTSGGSSFGLAGSSFCDTINTAVSPASSLLFTNLFQSLSYTVTDETNLPGQPPTQNPAGYLNGANVFSDNAIYQYMDIIISIGSYVIIQLIVLTADLVIVYSLTDSIARALGGSVRLQLGGKLRIAS